MQKKFTRPWRPVSPVAVGFAYLAALGVAFFLVAVIPH